MSSIVLIISISFLFILPNIEGQIHNDKSSYQKCLNHQKMCFGFPAGCIQSETCEILGSSFPNLSKITFELLAPINSNNANNHYIAYGLSKINKMSGSVTQCYLDSEGVPQLGFSYNIPHKNQLIENVTGITLISTDYKDGVLHCVWTRDVITEVNGETFDLANNKYFIQLSKGEMNGKSPKYHGTNKISTNDAQNLQSTGIPSAAGVSIYIKWHGSLMIFAWVGCVSTGVIMARYYREDWPSVTVFGVKIWFLAHRAIMTMSWMSMIASIVLIWYYKNEWSGPYAHPVLGIISVLFATLQIIGSFMRPNPGSDKRWIFDWVHWFGGNLAHILAFCAIFMAHINWVNVYLPKSFFWVFTSFIFFYLLIQDAMKKLAFRSPVYSFKKSSAQQSSNAEDIYENIDLPSDSKALLKMIVLGIYLLVIFVITITLILLITTLEL